MPPHSRVRVAVFLTSFASGGTERQMTELVRRLDRTRFEVHAACFHRDGVWLPRVAPHVESLAAFPIHSFSSPSTLAAARRFARWCRDTRIDVLQTCGLYPNVFALPAAAVAHVPVRVGSRREVNPDKTAAHIVMQRAAYAAAHVIVANSRAAAERLAREGVARSRVRIIPNGVDISLPHVHRGMGGAPPRVLMVAKLRAEKGHDVLIRAAAAVARAVPAVEFLIAGDGPMEASLKSLCVSSRAAHRFRFLGHRDDIPTLLASSDVFVLPSRSEALPNSVIEAMAAGLPVVATSVGGIPELVEHGRTGLLVPPDDPAALGSALVRLLQNPSEARALGGAAQADAASRFSFERMVTSFQDLYLSALEARKPLGASPALGALAR